MHMQVNHYPKITSNTKDASQSFFTADHTSHINGSTGTHFIHSHILFSLKVKDILILSHFKTRNVPNCVHKYTKYQPGYNSNKQGFSARMSKLIPGGPLPCIA